MASQTDEQTITTLRRIQGRVPVRAVAPSLTCVFIAYVPVMRLVHSCATPLGRMAHSQTAMLAAKKKGVLGAMLLKPQPDSSIARE